MIILSFWRPVVLYGSRYMSHCQPFLLLALVGGIVAFPRRWNILLAGAIVMVWLMAVQNGVNDTQKRRYDLAAEAIVRTQGKYDRVIADPPFTYQCLAYFRPAVAPALEVPQEALVTQVKRTLQTGAGVWIVTVSPANNPQEDILQSLARCDLTYRVPKGDLIRVSRYVRSN